LKADVLQVTAQLPAPVATYLLNRKRKELSDLEGKRAIGITIIARDDLTPGQMEVAYDKKNKPWKIPALTLCRLLSGRGGLPSTRTN
jgi:Ribonuclease G/E